MTLEQLFGAVLGVLLVLAVMDVLLVLAGLMRISVGLQKARHTLLRRTGGDPAPVSVIVPLPVGHKGHVERELALELVERLSSFGTEIEIQLVVCGDVDAWDELAGELALLRELSGGRVLDAAASRYRLESNPGLHVMFVGAVSLARAYDIGIASAYYPLVCLFPPRQILDRASVVALVRSLESESLAAIGLAAPSRCLSVFDRSQQPTLKDLRTSAASRLGGVRWCGCGFGGPGPDAMWPAPVLVRRKDLVDLGGLSALCDEAGLAGDCFETVAPALGRLLVHLESQAKPHEVAVAGDARSDHLGEPAQLGNPIWFSRSSSLIWQRLATFMNVARYAQAGGALIAVLLAVTGVVHAWWLGLAVLLALAVPAASMLVALLAYEWIVPMASSNRQLLAMSGAALLEGSLGFLPRAHGEAG